MADIKIKKDHCPLILTHSLIGGKWKLKILWHILQGDNRFSELKKEIPGISEKVLYSNLKELEDARLLYREVIKEEAVRDSLPSFRRRRGGQGTDRCGTPVCQSVCKKAYTY